MLRDKIQERFGTVGTGDECLEFDRVDSKRTERPDLHALLLLEELFPGYSMTVAIGGMFDRIYFGVDIESINQLTEGNVLELVRCGVKFEKFNESLLLHVG